MTRTSRARIRPFTRICGCRLDSSPHQRNGSAPRRRISIYRILGVSIRKRQALSPRRSCDLPPRGARITVRKPNRSCRQQFRTGKVNLVTITCRSCDQQSRSLCRRVAKVRFVCGVHSRVIQHRIDCCRQRLKFYYAGKNGAVADLRVDHECRPLRDLESTKFGG